MNHHGVTAPSGSVGQRILGTMILLCALMFSISDISGVSADADADVDNNININNDNNNHKIIRCGIYLAPSSIPGAGIGMYVGNRSIAPQEIVTHGDIVIPIVERPWHIEERLSEESFLWNEYIWNSDTFPFTGEEIGDNLMGYMDMASPGVGAAANSYLSMVNIEEQKVRVSRAGVHPESPGHGAFTIYHGRSFFAKDEMEPGQEIFVR